MGAAVDVLLPYQRAWVLDRSPVKICEKSRRTGITWATALEAVITAASPETPQDWHFLTYAQEDSKAFIDDCANWARFLGVVCDAPIVEDDNGINVLRIRFKTGKSVYGRPGKARNLRGKQGVACIDEAAFVDDLDGIMKAATAFRMWGGRVVLISTHFGETNPFNTRVGMARDGKQGWSLHSIPLVDAIEQGLAERICTMRGEQFDEAWAREWEDGVRADYGEDAAEELDCVPTAQGAGYFDTDSVNRCRHGDCKVLRWELDREWFERERGNRAKECEAWIEAELMPVLRGLNPQRGSFVGVDFARYSDMSSWAICQMYGEIRRVVCVIELRNMPQAQQEQILGAIMQHCPRLGRAAVDRTGNGQALYEWAAERYGSQVDGLTLGPKWHDESWPELRKAIAERHVDLPDDDECCGDFRLVELIDGKPRVAKRRTRARGGYRHGDFAVACCLMYAASNGAGGRVVSARVPKVRKRSMW